MDGVCNRRAAKADQKIQVRVAEERRDCGLRRERRVKITCKIIEQQNPEAPLCVANVVRRAS